MWKRVNVGKGNGGKMWKKVNVKMGECGKRRRLEGLNVNKW